MPNHGQGGRKKIPPHLKLVRGTFREDRDGPRPGTEPAGGHDDEPVVEVPPVPLHLSPGAAEIFLEIGQVLVGKFVRSHDFIHLLAEAAACLQEVRHCRAVCEDLGYTYMHPGTFGDVPKVRPEYLIQAKSLARAESILSRFGLTPADVPKLGSAERGKQADDFDEF